ncbi:MAG: salivary glue protein Sgs-3, partial [Eggerthella sp.]|nr:salivary glue protein Sgs-3 [Eggerthella sp.]
MAEEPVVIGDPAPRTRKWPIVVGVVVVVLIAAGAGFWVWHEQPSFCAAICHTPMDEY